MALEGAPPLLRVGDRSPDDDSVPAALLDVDDVDRTMLRRPLRARLRRRRFQVRVARSRGSANLRRDLGGRERGLDSAAAKCRSREHD
jgi:hypothetical protein